MIPVNPAAVVNSQFNTTYPDTPAALAGDKINATAIEDQLIAFLLAPTSGDLILSFKGVNAAAILFSNINAANIQTQLRLLAQLGAITVLGSVGAGFVVKFVGYSGNAPSLGFASSTLDNMPTVTQIHEGR